MSKYPHHSGIIKMIILVLIAGVASGTESWNSVLEDYSIIDILPYENGYWVATESNGAFRYDRETDQWYRYNQDNGIMSQNDNINDMKIMDGKVWFATNYGLYTCNIDGGSWKHTLLPGDYFTNWIRAFDENSNTVFIAAFTGLFTYSKATKSFTEHDISLPENYQTSYTNSVFATDSLTWIGTDDGVFRYDTSLPLDDPASRTYLNKNNAFNTQSDIVMCRSICATDGGIWVGLDEYTPSTNPSYCVGGLFFSDSDTWTKFDQSTGLPADGIHFIQQHGDRIYAGLFHYIDGVNFNGEGLLVLDPRDNSWRVLNEQNWHIGNKNIRSFYCNETDTLVGTETGLFTNNNELPDLKPFEAPEWFSLRSLGGGTMEVRVDPVYLAERYDLYISMDGLDFNDTLAITDTCDTLTGLDMNRAYYAKIAARNDYGCGPACPDVLGTLTGADTNSILMIQGFDKEMPGNTFDFCVDHSRTFIHSGIGFDAISDEALLETDINPDQYDMIDWICGVDNDIMIPENKEFISSFLESGGKLFISGSQLIEGVTGVNTDAEFYNGYLKAAWKKSDAGSYEVQNTSSGIFNGIGNMSFDDGSLAFDVSRPDGIIPVNGAEACMLYAGKDSANYGSAALYFSGNFGSSTEEGRLVYLGFPIESVTSDSLQDAIMLCVLDYFDYDVVLTGNHSSSFPQTMRLEQNYPNPFNPMTRITFSLSVDDHIDMSIYDLSGRFIANLISEYKTAGEHEIFFNASDLCSGVYICRLQAGEHVRSMKMLLLK